jgi:putative oxidoreductase
MSSTAPQAPAGAKTANGEAETRTRTTAPAAPIVGAQTSTRRAAPDSDSRGAELALLLVRVALGAIFIAHALLKLLGFGLPAPAEFFTSVGYPGWSAWPVFAIELIGGIALVAGVRVRLAALALVPVMIGALLVHAPNGWRFDATGGGWEYVAFLIVALIAQAVAGTRSSGFEYADES